MVFNHEAFLKKLPCPTGGASDKSGQKANQVPAVGKMKAMRSEGRENYSLFEMEKAPPPAPILPGNTLQLRQTGIDNFRIVVSHFNQALRQLLTCNPLKIDKQGPFVNSEWRVNYIAACIGKDGGCQLFVAVKACQPQGLSIPAPANMKHLVFRPHKGKRTNPSPDSTHCPITTSVAQALGDVAQGKKYGRWRSLLNSDRTLSQRRMWQSQRNVKIAFHRELPRPGTGAIKAERSRQFVEVSRRKNDFLFLQQPDIRQSSVKIQKTPGWEGMTIFPEKF
jgi:hypothetical protein